MISTYLLYRSYAANLPKTHARVAAEPDVSKAAQYYRANIGKVKSVDQFLNDRRLFAYAMNAYGLSDMTYAKAFMRKVLTSDLSKQTSFVNKLTDPRFLAFAKAYQFSTDGTVAKQAVIAQNSTEEDNTVEAYTQQQVKKGAAAATEATYYQANIGNVTSIGQLMGNPRLLRYAVTAYGLNPDLVSNATIKAVLTSDLSNPTSVANTLKNPGYKALARAFNFNTDGSINGTAQSASNTATTVYQYYNATGTNASPAAAAFKSQYYKATISSVTSVDDFLANNALVDVALTAFGFNPNIESRPHLRQLLTSDLSDPNSLINQKANAQYKKLVQAFNFNADGSVNGSIESADQLKRITGLYSSAYDDAQQAANNVATSSYRDAIASVTSVKGLLKTTALNYIMSAYGLDPETTNTATLTRILESDPSDPNSFANQSHNAAYIALASAFNFDSQGNAKTANLAQTNANLSATVKAYISANGGVPTKGATPTQQQALATTESTYYAATINKITKVDNFLKDSRLVKYALSALGLEKAGLSNAALHKILTSDPQDPSSYINKPENAKYRPLALAFNFGADGNTTLRVSINQVQDRSQIVATSNGHVEQTTETEAGNQSQGARLALYFLRKAPNITSPFQILADKALLQFTQIALGLSANMSKASIDTQAAMITKKLNLADLQNPAKLNKLIAQFAAFYDINNSNGNKTSPVVQILQGR